MTTRPFIHTYAPRQESELAINIRKATSIEEVSPKRMFQRIVEPWQLELIVAQESMSEHALYIHGTTRAPRAFGRA